jgi:Uma2 family endonuclease
VNAVLEVAPCRIRQRSIRRQWRSRSSTPFESQDDQFIWELIADEIVGMTNPALNHELIAGNIGVGLNLAIRARGCEAFQGRARVQSSDDPGGIYKPQPDIVLQCGPSRGERTYVSDPVVIIEVLSRGTVKRDRGVKLEFYQSLPSLRHIALVHQNQMRVEHYRRGKSGWEKEVLSAPDDRVAFDAVGFEMELRGVYRRIAFGRPRQQPTDLA